MKDKKRLANRIALLVMMLIVMALACGCRTRITNNDAVSNVMYDEDGYMTEEYQMRRDDLGLSTAKAPIFKGLGAPDDDTYGGDYYDGDSAALEDYDPDEYEEEYEEPEDSDTKSTTPSTSRTTSGSRTTTPGTGSRIVRRRVTRTTTTGGTKPGTTTTTSQEIEVLLNANGGKCSASSVKVKSGSTYGKLPTPTRSGYKFSGWYTQKADGKGTKVTSSTKVIRTVKHTLYAHWKQEKQEEKKEEKKTYTLTFDINSPDDADAALSGNSQMTVTEGGTYSGLPSASCTGYTFSGWYTDAADGAGTRIDSKSKVSITSDQTLYAHWEKDPVKYWTAELNSAVNPLKKEDKFRYKKDSKGSDFLNDSGMREGSDDDYDYLICYGSTDDAKKMDNPDSKPVLVISKDAASSKTSKEAKLLYKLKLTDYLYYEGSGLDISKAAGELGIDESDLEDIDIYTPPEDETPGEDPSED